MDDVESGEVPPSSAGAAAESSGKAKEEQQQEEGGGGGESSNDAQEQVPKEDGNGQDGANDLEEGGGSSAAAAAQTASGAGAEASVGTVWENILLSPPTSTAEADNTLAESNDNNNNNDDDDDIPDVTNVGTLETVPTAEESESESAASYASSFDENDLVEDDQADQDDDDDESCAEQYLPSYWTAAPNPNSSRSIDASGEGTSSGSKKGDGASCCHGDDSSSACLSAADTATTMQMTCGGDTVASNSVMTEGDHACSSSSSSSHRHRRDMSSSSSSNILGPWPEYDEDTIDEENVADMLANAENGAGEGRRSSASKHNASSKDRKKRSSSKKHGKSGTDKKKTDPRHRSSKGRSDRRKSSKSKSRSRHKSKDPTKSGGPKSAAAAAAAAGGGNGGSTSRGVVQWPVQYAFDFTDLSLLSDRGNAGPTSNDWSNFVGGNSSRHRMEADRRKRRRRGCVALTVAIVVVVGLAVAAAVGGAMFGSSMSNPNPNGGSSSSTSDEGSVSGSGSGSSLGTPTLEPTAQPTSGGILYYGGGGGGGQEDEGEEDESATATTVTTPDPDLAYGGGQQQQEEEEEEEQEVVEVADPDLANGGGQQEEEEDVVDIATPTNPGPTGDQQEEEEEEEEGEAVDPEPAYDGTAWETDAEDPTPEPVASPTTTLEPPPECAAENERAQECGATNAARPEFCCTGLVCNNRQSFKCTVPPTPPPPPAADPTPAPVVDPIPAPVSDLSNGPPSPAPTAGNILLTPPPAITSIGIVGVEIETSSDDGGGLDVKPIILPLPTDPPTDKPTEKPTTASPTAAPTTPKPSLRPTSPPTIQSFCPNGSSDVPDPDRIIPDGFTLNGRRTTCGELARAVPSIVDDDETLALLRSYAPYCDCPNANHANVCTLCPYGSEPTHPTYATPAYGDTCLNLHRYVRSTFTTADCFDGRLGQFEPDMVYCGCFGAPEPRCSLCPDGGNDMLAHPGRTIPGRTINGEGVTCGMMAAYADAFVGGRDGLGVEEAGMGGGFTSSGRCDEDVQIYAEYCGCVPQPRGECTLCEDGYGVPDPDMPLPADIGGTCGDVEEWVAFLDDDDCRGDALADLRGIASYCRCPGTEPLCSLCPDGTDVPDPDRPALADVGRSCGDLAALVSTYGEDRCAADIVEIERNAVECGCPGYPQPGEYCTLCPDGVSPANPDTIADTDTAGGVSCHDLDFLVSVMTEHICEANRPYLQPNAALCGCPGVDFPCTLCPDGSVPPYPDLRLGNGDTCQDAHRNVLRMTEDECDSSSGDLEIIAYECKCPGASPTCSLCPMGAPPPDPDREALAGNSCRDVQKILSKLTRSSCIAQQSAIKANAEVCGC